MNIGGISLSAIYQKGFSYDFKSRGDTPISSRAIESKSSDSRDSDQTEKIGEREDLDNRRTLAEA